MIVYGVYRHDSEDGFIGSDFLLDQFIYIEEKKAFDKIYELNYNNIDKSKYFFVSEIELK